MYIFFKVKKVKCYVNDGLRNFKVSKIDKQKDKLYILFYNKIKNEKMLVT